MGNIVLYDGTNVPCVMVLQLSDDAFHFVVVKSNFISKLWSIKHDFGNF